MMNYFYRTFFLSYIVVIVLSDVLDLRPLQFDVFFVYLTIGSIVGVLTMRWFGYSP